MKEQISILVLTLYGDACPTIRYFEPMARAIDKSQFRIVFGTIRSSGALQTCFEQYNHKTFFLNCRSRLQYPRAVMKLRQIINNEKVDILHGHEELGGFLCGVAGILAGRPVRIYHRHHDVTLPYNPKELIKGTIVERLRSRLAAVNYRLLDTVAGNIADRVFVVSENHRKIVLEEHKHWTNKIRVALNGSSNYLNIQMENNNAQHIRQELGISKQARVLTMVGRLNWRKGHTILFEALRQDKELNENAVLLVIGSGELESELRGLASQMGLRHIHFVGNQSNVYPWYLTANVVIVPSRVEPFGLVATEAMSCAKPIVATRVGGLQEIILDKKTGLLVPPEDPIALAQAIQKLITNPTLAKKMGEAGRERYESVFTAEAMIHRWERYYLEAIKAH